MYSGNGSGVRIKIINPPFSRFSINKEDEKFSIIFDGETYPVMYNDDKSKLCPQINRKINNENWINANDTGRYKRKAWQFQNEWGSRLFVFKNNGDIGMLQPGVIPPIGHYDVALKESVINNFTITLGYNISPGNRIIVEMLVDEYNKNNNANIIIEASELTDLIKPKAN